MCVEQEKSLNPNSGVALIAVMCTLIVLSAVAITMAVSLQTEARIDGADFESLQAEQLARSGQEFASFLEARGMAASNADLLAGLPFAAETPGFHYQAQLDIGTVDIYFEADNGKINPSTAPPELINNFFTEWTGDSAKAQIISDSIGDWLDPDDNASLNGAEAPFYAGLSVAPRNGPLGVADLPFIRGMSVGDFQPKLIPTAQELQVRQALDLYLTTAPVGAEINPNFAPELVLRAIPGLSASQVSMLIALRRNQPFKDMSEFQARTGLNPNSPAWHYLTTYRNAPAVLTVAKLKASGLTRSERRIAYRFLAFNYASGALDPKTTLGRIEKNVFPDFL